MRRDYFRKRLSKNPLFAPPQERRGRFRFWFTMFIGACAAGGWIWFMGWSETLRVTEVEINGDQAIAEWEIRDVVRDMLDEKRWGFFPKRNILSFSEDELAGRLNERFVFERLEVTKLPPHGLKIDLVERVSTVLMQLPDGSQALLDLDGAVVRLFRSEEAMDVTVRLGPTLEETPEAPRSRTPVVYNDRQAALKLRDKALTPKMVQAAISLPDAFEREFGRGIYVTELRTDGLEASTLRLVTSEGWSVYLDAEQAIDLQLSNADDVIRSKAGGDRRNVDYVDVRFGEKVFLKLRT